MPNWCENTLNVQTTKEVWDTIVRPVLFIEDYEPKQFETITEFGKFSFAVLKRTPIELEGVSAPNRIVTRQEYQKWLSTVYWSPKDNEQDFMMRSRPVTQETYDKYMAIYGCANWYDWRLANWGCKWDADCYGCEFQVRETTGPDRVNVSIHFTTPWSPPSAWFASLCDALMSQGVYMELRYSEDGMGFAGTYFFDDTDFWESDGEIYPVDDSTGERVKYDDKLERWRSETGKFVSDDCIRNEIIYDSKDIW